MRRTSIARPQAALKSAGLKTVQYVSPQVWAWRQSRAATMRDAVDLVLCLLPFEPKFYAEHGVNAKFVGHPLADMIPLTVDKAEARAKLGLPVDRPVLAVLPGSRRSEVSRLSAPFMATAAWLKRARPELTVAVALASDATAELFRAATAGMDLHGAALIPRKAREVMAAADVVLTASGTASLEALLHQTADGGRVQDGAADVLARAPARCREAAQLLVAEPARGPRARAGVRAGPGAGRRARPGSARGARRYCARTRLV